MDTEDISKELKKILTSLKNNNIKIESETPNSFATSVETENDTSESSESVILESEAASTTESSEKSMTPINGPSKISQIFPDTEMINKKYVASSIRENMLPSPTSSISNTSSKIYKLHNI